LLESVLNSLAPSALYPVFSGAVLELTLNYGNEQARSGAILPAGTVVDALIPTINTPCRFSTLEDASLVPLGVAEAEYMTRSLSDFGINNPQGLAGLRIKFAVGSTAPASPDQLCFYINLAEADASLLLRQILHETVGVYVRHGEEEQFSPCPGVSGAMPLAVGEKLLPGRIKGQVRGLRALQNFLSYPAFFKFFTLGNLREALAPSTDAPELLLVFSRREPSLVSLKASSLRLNCAPAVNLFAKRSDRVLIEREAHQFHLVPDRAAPLDYEAAVVERLEFFNQRNETVFFADNFYEDNPLEERSRKNFFSLRRRKSLVNPHVTRRSSYEGAEAFVSVSIQDKKMEEAYQFAADMICTNRDLPLLVPAEVSCVPRSPFLGGAAFIARPTRPGYSLFHQGAASDFSKISHLVFNLSSLLWQNGKFPLEAFRTLLGSYRIRSAEEMERMLEGIVSLESERATFRFIEKGAVFFEPGWKITFTLDETAYAGVGHYIFGRIVAEVLQSFSSLNTLLEIQFFTKQSGRIAVWKTLED
jgi:type VI secretion system protein ImpG